MVTLPRKVILYRHQIAEQALSLLKTRQQGRLSPNGHR